jgi:RNA polymerase sigma factor (sigma-70 family)
VTQALANAHGETNPSADIGLIQSCLKGSEEAWSRLIEKYKGLIFSVPIKAGLSPDDAADIFQAVCLDLLSELPRLRHSKALPRWLIQVTYHKCIRRRADQQRYAAIETEGEEWAPVDGGEQLPEGLLYELERSQKIREVLSELEPRCRQLIEALFFESPARPYREVAQSLDLAVGSVGPVRKRCLEHVRKLLEKAGLA